MRTIGQMVSARVQEDSRPRALPVQSGPLAELRAVGLVMAGAALVIWAYRLAPTAAIQSYDPIFWAGMLLAYLAIAWRVVSGPHSVLWLGLLGLFALLPKFCMSLDGPLYFDEIAHFALLQNILATGRLFQSTPLLPIATFYPGLESAAAAIRWLTGLPLWDSALALIAVAHCLLPVQVYYIARALPVPHRWAAVAGLVFAANPGFVYGDAIFGYETLAILLMLTVVRLYVEALAAERSGTRTWRQSLSTALLIAVASFGLVVTHHLYSLVGIALLLAGALFIKPMSGLADRKGGWRRLFVRWMPVLTLVTCFGLWFAFVAPTTGGYLSPYVSGTASELAALVNGSTGSGATRAVFAHSTSPIYEQAAAVAAPIIIAVAFLFAGIRWLRKPALRSNFLWSFVPTAAYLAGLPLTLTTQGQGGAHFTWPSTYVGVALLPAALAGLFELDKRSWWRKRTAAAGMAVLAVLLVGNVAAGTSVDERFPGPYQFGSDTLSATPETLAFASWVKTHLGSGAHVVTDRFTALALTAHADAFTPMQSAGGGAGLPFASIWYVSDPPAPALMSAMERQGDDYLAVDVRDAQYADTGAALFYTDEPKRVPLPNMTRLAHWPWLRLLYSSQHYRLYKIDFPAYFSWAPAHASGG
jgi:hypothetical protein